MELRKLIIRITGISIIFLIIAITMMIIAYKEHKKTEYTYVINDEFYKSKNCYIDNIDNRICETKDGIIKVDYYYE